MAEQIVYEVIRVSSRPLKKKVYTDADIRVKTYSAPGEAPDAHPAAPAQPKKVRMPASESETPRTASVQTEVRRPVFPEAPQEDVPAAMNEEIFGGRELVMSEETEAAFSGVKKKSVKKKKKPNPLRMLLMNKEQLEAALSDTEDESEEEKYETGEEYETEEDAGERRKFFDIWEELPDEPRNESQLEAAEIINEDGYYDTVLPPDTNEEHTRKRNVPMKMILLIIVSVAALIVGSYFVIRGM